MTQMAGWYMTGEMVLLSLVDWFQLKRVLTALPYLTFPVRLIGPLHGLMSRISLDTALLGSLIGWMESVAYLITKSELIVLSYQWMILPFQV